jgi:myo-inositol-1-phosphate synthase
MANRRVGLWLVGAFGGVGSTVAMGLSALSRGLATTTGLVTANPLVGVLPLDAPADFVVGGHDTRRSTFRESALGLNERSGLFTARLIEACSPDLLAWSENVQPAPAAGSPKDAIDRVQADVRAFQKKHALDQVVVLNVASTEPPFAAGPEHASLAALQAALSRTENPALPASGVYAYAALDMGLPYVNFTPSFGATSPAMDELARLKKAPYAGQDGKTGETLLKTVLAPMFAARNLKVHSWIGHNILGGGDGRTLSNPENKASKVKSKDASLPAILGYKPQSLVSIEYVESLDDWKTAWDHIHFEGFLGTKMTLQFTWQGCDSILAAPLAIDLARLALFAQRQGHAGVLSELACFFKSPLGTTEQDFFKQWRMFEAFVGRHGG